MAETSTSISPPTFVPISSSPAIELVPVQVQPSSQPQHHDTQGLEPKDNDLETIHENSRGSTELATFEKTIRHYTHASTTRYASSTLSVKPTTPLGRLVDGVRKFWRRQISITVEHKGCRDHLALERTFLGYLRTSLALSMMGVVVAQLFRLDQLPEAAGDFGFYVIGKPLACICQGAAMYSLAIGCFRTWRSQNAIVRGKAISGGFEIVALALGVFFLLLVFLVLLVVVNVLKEDVS